MKGPLCLLMFFIEVAGLLIRHIVLASGSSPTCWPATSCWR